MDAIFQISSLMGIYIKIYFNESLNWTVFNVSFNCVSLRFHDLWLLLKSKVNTTSLFHRMSNQNKWGNLAWLKLYTQKQQDKKKKICCNQLYDIVLTINNAVCILKTLLRVDILLYVFYISPGLGGPGNK